MKTGVHKSAFQFFFSNFRGKIILAGADFQGLQPDVFRFLIGQELTWELTDYWPFFAILLHFDAKTFFLEAPLDRLTRN